MRIRALLDVFSAGHKGLKAGQEYDVTEAFGQMLVERDQAEKVKVTEAEPKHKESNKKSTK